jgi:hypothetical protein
LYVSFVSYSAICIIALESFIRPHEFVMPELNERPPPTDPAYRDFRRTNTSTRQLATVSRASTGYMYRKTKLKYTPLRTKLYPCVYFKSKKLKKYLHQLFQRFIFIK